MSLAKPASLIEFANVDQLLNGDKTALLFEFLAQHQQTTFWEKNETIILESEQAMQNCGFWWSDPQKFKLSHRIVVGKRKDNQPGLCFDVVSNELLGQGVFGEVYPILYTLEINGTQIVKSNNECVVKIQQLDFWTDEASIVSEYENIRLARHLGLKSLIEESTPEGAVVVMVMQKLPGRNLRDILFQPPQYFNQIRPCPLTTKQLVELSVAIVKAYKEQVYDLGLIHGDIKLDNIVVDLKDPIVVNFCDYGMSSRINQNNQLRRGTPAYCAPEQRNLKGIKTDAIDIYALGKTLAYLWGCEIQEGGDINFKFLFACSHLCNGDQQIMTEVLSGMCESVVAQRSSIESIINQFNQLYLNTNRQSVSQKQLLTDGVFRCLNNIARRVIACEMAGEHEIAEQIRQLENQIRYKTLELKKESFTKTQRDEYIDSCVALIAQSEVHLGNATAERSSIIGYLADLVLFLLGFKPSPGKANLLNRNLFFRTTPDKALVEPLNTEIAELEKEVNLVVS